MLLPRVKRKLLLRPAELIPFVYAFKESDSDSFFRPIKLCEVHRSNHILKIMSNLKLVTEWFSKEDVPLFLSVLRPGDLLEFQRNGYCHWAVYIGEFFFDNSSHIQLTQRSKFDFIKKKLLTQKLFKIQRLFS